MVPQHLSLGFPCISSVMEPERISHLQSRSPASAPISLQVLPQPRSVQKSLFFTSLLLSPFSLVLPKTGSKTLFIGGLVSQREEILGFHRMVPPLVLTAGICEPLSNSYNLIIPFTGSLHFFLEGSQSLRGTVLKID